MWYINLKQEKKGIILPSILVSMLFLTTLLTISLLRTQEEMTGVIAQSRSTAALYAAESGLERTVARLRIDPLWRDGFGSHESPEPLVSGNVTIGYYIIETGTETTESEGWTRIPVTAIGMDATGEFRRAISASIITQNPAWFFIFSSDNVQLTSGAYITGSIFAQEIYFQIPPIPESDNITITEHIFYVKNDGVHGYPHEKIHVTYEPKQSKPLTFPSLNISHYSNLAKNGGAYYDSDLYLNGLSVEEGKNGVIFVDGDLYIQGEIENPSTIVANGDIYINGDITYGDGGKLGLFSKNNIYISEDAPEDIQINAMLIADGGEFIAKGEKYSKETLTFNGTMSVRGKSNLEKGCIDLSVYSVREYNFDASLKQYPLPYVTFIANLDSWREIPPPQI